MNPYNIIKNIPSEAYSDVGFKTISTNPCSEIPLSAFDSCRLISINLKHFVKDRFTEKAKFDFRAFGKTARAAQRLSDDLVELELEKLNNIIGVSDTNDEKDMWRKLYKAASEGRRTGLGTHGLADALANLCIAYDSDESAKVVDKIYSTLKINSYTESSDLAVERGSFPVWDWDKEKDNLFIRSLPKKLRNLIEKQGRRNIANLTNAPTGSVSLVSQTSSGLEPVFKNEHIRRKKRNHNEASADTDFVDDIGDRWQEFNVSHHNVREWADMFPGQDIPSYFTESGSIDWMRRVELQGVIQKHVDHALSSTINLPRGTSKDVVGELYMEGWKHGLKGVTVYVDGSRSGVLVSAEDTETQKFQYRESAERPDSLPCNIHQVRVKGEKWTILVGLLDGKPYEVFGGRSELIEIPKKHTKGLLTKAMRGRKNYYNLDLGDDWVINNVTKVFDNPTHQVHTRMLSLALRHSARPALLVDQLLKDPDNDLTSLSKVLARVLKKYIENGETVGGDKVCPECSCEALVYQEGCMTCTGCGFAKCG